MSGTLQVGGITLGTHNSGTGKVDITNAGTVNSGTITNAVTFPAGHVIQILAKQDSGQGQYTSDQIPLGGSTNGLFIENITPQQANSKFLIQVQIQSGWGAGGDGQNSFGTMATDWGLRIRRTKGSTATDIGGGTNVADRGGNNSWYGNDDCNRGYAPYDTRCFVINYLDSPSASTSDTLKYEVGVFGAFQKPFNYNRAGHNAGNSSGMSAIIVTEVAA